MDIRPHRRSTRRHRPLRPWAALALGWIVGIGSIIALAPMAAATESEPQSEPDAVRDIIFPVAGTVRYSDTYGACRSGCTRAHEGEDLMAAKLTPLVAARDATVRWLKGDATPDGSHGNYVMLRDDDGWEYWYIHLNNDSPGTDDGANPAEWRFGPGVERGQRVRAGQLVGYVGDSGNAEWTGAHVHFEIRRPDGSVVNPNPSLRAATRLTEPVVFTEGPAADELFVRALSLDFLGRPAEDIRLARALAALRSGRSPAEIVADHAASDEWVSALITGYYRSTLGRAPDAGGLRHWIGVIGAGVTPADVAADFYASAEYFHRSGGTNEGWVTDLYVELLARRPDANGLAYWHSVLDDGASRAEVASSFYGSIESRRARVANLYRTLLGRSPDAGGHAYWADLLSNGRDIDLATNLASSTEYRTRAARRGVQTPG